MREIKWKLLTIKTKIMRIKIEDYYGNDIVELQIENIRDYHITETDEYNIADVDEDDRGEYIRVQLTNDLHK